MHWPTASSSAAGRRLRSKTADLDEGTVPNTRGCRPHRCDSCGPLLFRFHSLRDDEFAFPAQDLDLGGGKRIADDDETIAVRKLSICISG